MIATGLGFEILNLIWTGNPAKICGVLFTVGTFKKLFSNVSGSTTRRLTKAESGAPDPVSVEAIPLTLLGCSPARDEVIATLNSQFPPAGRTMLDTFSVVVPTAALLVAPVHVDVT